MTGAILAEMLYASDNALIESALPDSGTLRRAKKKQREAKTLAVRVLSSLVLLGALALLIARCALHIENKKRSGIASRRLSDHHLRSHDSSEPSTSSPSSDPEFHLPSYEEACTHQHAISVADEETEGGEGDRLPSYEEACSQSPPGSSGCEQAARIQRTGLRPAGLPSYEEACCNMAQRIDGQARRSQPATAGANNESTQRLPRRRNRLRRLWKSAHRALTTIFAENRGNQGAQLRDPPRQERFGFPRLGDAWAASFLQSLVQYLEDMPSEVPPQGPKQTLMKMAPAMLEHCGSSEEFGAVLMGLHYTFNIFQESPHEGWPNAGALQQFAESLESCVLGTAASLVEDQSQRQSTRTIEISSSRGDSLLGRTVITITARRPPAYTESS